MKGVEIGAGFAAVAQRGTTHGDEIEMTGFVASIDGTKMVKEKVRGSAQQAEKLGQLLAEKLVALGANEILASLETH